MKLSAISYGYVDIDDGEITCDGQWFKCSHNTGPKLRCLRTISQIP